MTTLPFGAPVLAIVVGGMSPTRLDRCAESLDSRMHPPVGLDPLRLWGRHRGWVLASSGTRVWATERRPRANVDAVLQ